MPHTSDAWTRVRTALDGASFGPARVRLSFVDTRDFSLSLFGRGAPFHVYGKGKFLEITNVGAEVYRDDVVQLFHGYELDVLEIKDNHVRDEMTLASRIQAEIGIQHARRSNFVCFMTREEAHRALRDLEGRAVLAGRPLHIRVVK